MVDGSGQLTIQLTGPKELVIVPEATHLFEEPGALEEVARLARDWFTNHFQQRLRRAHNN